LVAVAFAAALLAGCSAKDSPTAPPTGGGGVPAGSAGNAGAWVVTVTASPSTVHTNTVFSDELSTIVVTVRNSQTGAPPPDGSTVVLVASGGTLGNGPSLVSGQTTVTRELVAGQASDAFRASAASESFTATVRATFAASSGVASIQVIVEGTEPAFAVNSVSPNVGDPAGGIEATIFGSNIEGIVKVLFGSSSARVLSVSPTRIRVVVPPFVGTVPVGGSVPVNVTVTNAFGTIDQESDTIVNGFIYANGGSTEVPVIFTITPTTGPQEGLTPIVINGSHFTDESQVIFRLAGSGGSIDVEAPTNTISSTRIEALTPDIRNFIAAGQLTSPFNAQVRVINPNGAVGIFSGFFTYGSTIRITAISPGQGDYTGGTHVTIHGNGFDEPVAVTLGGIGQSVVSVSGTEVVFITSGLTGNAIPACGGQTTATVALTNLEGGASATGPSFAYIGPRSPVIFGVSPPSGSIGASVVVTGQNFDPTGLRVLFGGADGSAAPIAAAPAPTSGSVTVTVPTPPPSFEFTTTPCDGNGDNIASGERNQPTPISITVRNLATGCESTLSNAFTLNPSDVACNGDTSVPPTPPPAACNDGFDNDGDGLIDALDPQCTGPTDTSESS
jgi:hypothetical protein